MNQQDYNATITVNAPVQEAFKSVESVSKWWTENLEGSTKHFDDVFTVRFGETFVTFKTIELVPDKKIVWFVTDCNLHWLTNKKEWNGTRLSFELSTGNNLTTVRFTHIGLAPQIECYNDCRKGWDQYIKGSLSKLITEGRGLPERKK